MYFATLQFRWIPFFVNEIKRRDRKNYKAKSLFEFILGLQSLLKLKQSVVYNFLKDGRFIAIRNALDNVMKRRQEEGLGHNPRKADTVTNLMEETLWNNSLLGDSSPKLLLKTLVFSLGINLALRAGEHRTLRREMFSVCSSYSIC